MRGALIALLLLVPFTAGCLDDGCGSRVEAKDGSFDICFRAAEAALQFRAWTRTDMTWSAVELQTRGTPMRVAVNEIPDAGGFLAPQGERFSLQPLSAEVIQRGHFIGFCRTQEGTDPGGVSIWIDGDFLIGASLNALGPC